MIKDPGLQFDRWIGPGQNLGVRHDINDSLSLIIYRVKAEDLREWNVV